MIRYIQYFAKSSLERFELPLEQEDLHIDAPLEPQLLQEQDGIMLKGKISVSYGTVSTWLMLGKTQLMQAVQSVPLQMTIGKDLRILVESVGTGVEMPLAAQIQGELIVDSTRPPHMHTDKFAVRGESLARFHGAVMVEAVLEETSQHGYIAVKTAQPHVAVGFSLLNGTTRISNLKIDTCIWYGYDLCKPLTRHYEPMLNEEAHFIASEKGRAKLQQLERLAEQKIMDLGYYEITDWRLCVACRLNGGCHGLTLFAVSEAMLRLYFMSTLYACLCAVCLSSLITTRFHCCCGTRIGQVRMPILRSGVRADLSGLEMTTLMEADEFLVQPTCSSPLQPF